MYTFQACSWREYLEDSILHGYLVSGLDYFLLRDSGLKSGTNVWTACNKNNWINANKYDYYNRNMAKDGLKEKLRLNNLQITNLLVYC